MLLAGDVGGTKTALGIFRFLATTDLPIDRACFAVAGPVLDGRAKITNLPWMLDEKGLAEELGLASVRIINDLEAWDSFRYVAHPSKGGHGDFAPTTPLEMGLLQDLHRQFDRCAILGAVLYDFGSTSAGPPALLAT